MPLLFSYAVFIADTFCSVPERALELVLPDELQDSLRLLKPEGNLVTDRFRNILLRGKVESRRRIHQPRKARRTITEKWASKDFAIPTYNASSYY